MLKVKLLKDSDISTLENKINKFLKQKPEDTIRKIEVTASSDIHSVFMNNSMINSKIVYIGSIQYEEA